MELYGLFRNHQAQTNLGVGQAFDATQCHLGLATAQVSILRNSLDHSLVRTVAADGKPFPVGDKTIFFPAGDYFFRREHTIGNALVPRPVCMRAPLALNTELTNQTFKSAPDRAQALNSR